MSKSLVVPSAGYARRIYPLSAHKPKVLIELNGIPIFHLLYQIAVELQMDNIIIAINPEFENQLKEFIFLETTNKIKNTLHTSTNKNIDFSKTGIKSKWNKI